MDGLSRSRGWDKEIPHSILPIEQLVLSDKWARIDVSLFSPHSTRSATSSGVEKRFPVNTILKAASWQKGCTFRKFYNKPAMDTGFSKAINSII